MSPSCRYVQTFTERSNRPANGEGTSLPKGTGKGRVFHSSLPKRVVPTPFTTPRPRTPRLRRGEVTNAPSRTPVGVELRRNPSLHTWSPTLITTNVHDKFSVRSSYNRDPKHVRQQFYFVGPSTRSPHAGVGTSGLAVRTNYSSVSQVGGKEVTDERSQTTQVWVPSSRGFGERGVRDRGRRVQGFAEDVDVPETDLERGERRKSSLTAKNAGLAGERGRGKREDDRRKKKKRKPVLSRSGCHRRGTCTHVPLRACDEEEEEGRNESGWGVTEGAPGVRRG